MRIFSAVLLALMCVPSAFASTETTTGYAYYPSEKNPEYLLKLSGNVVNGKVAVKEAFLTPRLVSGTLSVTEAGQKIGLDSTKPGSRIGLGLQVNVNNQLGFQSNAADVQIFYPSKLTTLPKLILKAKNDTLKADCKRDPKQSKSNTVDASITIPPEVSKHLTFGDMLMVTVADQSNAALEQATFKVCPKQAYNQMLGAAIQSVIDKNSAVTNKSASETRETTQISPQKQSQSQKSEQ